MLLKLILQVHNKMEGRRPNRQNHDRYAGRLPNFGVSLFAICNDPEPDELVSDTEENEVEKDKVVSSHLKFIMT